MNANSTVLGSEYLNRVRNCPFMYAQLSLIGTSLKKRLIVKNVESHYPDTLHMHYENY